MGDRPPDLAPGSRLGIDGTFRRIRQAYDDREGALDGSTFPLDHVLTCRCSLEVREFFSQRRKRPRRSRPRESRRRRCVEERVSGSIRSEHVYSPTDRWDLIRRRLYSSGSPEPALWCLRDGLDPVAIIDSSANVLERYGYEAFGPVRFMDPAFTPRSASAHAWTWLFHAEFIDPETGLYNYGYRSYHPQLGR